MFSKPDPLLVPATVSDVDGDAVDESSITWTSNLDGSMGRGPEVTLKTADLAGGEHAIAVTVTDAAGSAGSTSVTIRVTHAAGHARTLPKAGRGSGTVTATGTYCGSDCSQTHIDGTLVTLTATPHPGSTFTSWTEDCSGSSSICHVTMDGWRSVTAIFTQLAPCRLYDSRLGSPSPLVAGETRSIAAAGKCDTPTGAAALALSITVTQPTAKGNLRLFPTGRSLPLVSTLDYSAGQTRANNAVAGLSGSGSLLSTARRVRAPYFE